MGEFSSEAGAQQHSNFDVSPPLTWTNVSTFGQRTANSHRFAKKAKEFGNNCATLAESSLLRKGIAGPRNTCVGMDSLEQGLAIETWSNWRYPKTLASMIFYA